MRSFLLLMTFVALAYPQTTSTTDVIVLKDGQIIQGQIIQYVPKEYVEIKSGSGAVLHFRMDDVLRVDFSSVTQQTTTATSGSQYERQIKIGKLGWATTAGVTLIGSAAMGDEMFGTTVIPVIGPFLTISRVESDPNAHFLPGAKDMLLFSGLVQTSFFSYWMYYAFKEPHSSKPQMLQISPNSDSIGLTISLSIN